MDLLNKVIIITSGDNGNCTSKQLLNNNMTMLLSSDKLVIMKIATCALVTIFIITCLSDDNITLLVFLY